jgi:hypothetical protein
VADPTLIGQGLYTALSGYATLITHLGGTAIFESIAPQGTNLPYIIFQWQGGGDENLTPGEMINEVWTVMGVSASRAQAGTLGADIHAALHMATLTVTGWTNFLCRGEETVRYVEIAPTGAPVYRNGRQYRVRLDI